MDVRIVSDGPFLYYVSGDCVISQVSNLTSDVIKENSHVVVTCEKSVSLYHRDRTGAPCHVTRSAIICFRLTNSSSDSEYCQDIRNRLVCPNGKLCDNQ